MKFIFKNQRLGAKKIILIMKYTLFFMFLGIASVSAVSYAQNTKLTLDMQNVTLYEVISEIEKQSEFMFFYKSGEIDNTLKVSIQAKDKTITEILNEIMTNADLAYIVNNKHVMIAKKNSVVFQQITVTGVVTDRFEEPMPGAQVFVKGTNMGVITDQEGKFEIKVNDQNSFLVFTYVGYVTQEIQVGNQHAINVTMLEDTRMIDEIIVVGYGTQKKINLTGSVAAVGSENLTNRPASNLTTILTGLASGVRITQGSGHPGNEGASIEIRGRGSINAGSPMILVDGVVTDMTIINPEDVESISILKDAASASIYGSQAANGVVLVTTKRGRNEKPKITFSALFAREKAVTTLKHLSDTPIWMRLHNEAQINTTPGITTVWYNEEHIKAWEEANKNPNGMYTDPTSGVTIPNKVAFPNTDWAQDWFQPMMYHRYNLSVSGGSEITQYLLSALYQDNPGAIENTGMKRFNIRTNVDSKIAGFLTIGTQTYAVKEFKDPGSMSMANFTQASTAIYPKYKGQYGGIGGTLNRSGNNLLFSIASRAGEYEQSHISSTWYAKADIWNGLSAEAKFNYYEYQNQENTHSRDIAQFNFILNSRLSIPNLETATTYRNSYFTKNYTTNLFLRYNGSFGEHDINAFAGYEQYYTSSSGFNLTTMGLLDWNVTDITSASTMNSWGGNAKTTLAILSYLGRVNYAYKNKYLFEANFRRDGSSRFAPEYRWGIFPSFSAGWRISEEPFFEPIKDIVDNLKLKASWGKLGSQVSGLYAWQSIYSKTNIVLDEKVQSGVIPSQVPNFQMSWEKTTNTNIGLEAGFLKKRLIVEFDYFNQMTTDMLVQPPQYLTLGSVATPMINDASMNNQGFDLSIGWNDKTGDFRYSADLNVAYSANRVTKYKGKLIYEEDPRTLDVWGNPTWRYTNFSDVVSGSNSITVEGHQVGEHYAQKPYTGTGTYYLSNGVIDPNGGPKDGMIRTKNDLDWVRAMIDAGYSFDNKAVSPAGAGNLWYGEMLLADINGDGRYGNSDDRVFTNKSVIPKWIFGFNLSAEYKGIDLSMLWSGALGSYYFIRGNGTNNSGLSIETDALPADAQILFYRYDAVTSADNGGINDYDPAKDPNANYLGKYPRLMTSNPNALSTYFLYNTSYLKLKSLQVGYTLPKKWLDPVKIGNLRVFVAGENLLTIQYKDFPGVDPEFGASMNVYPILRMISGGINITF